MTKTYTLKLTNAELQEIRGEIVRDLCSIMGCSDSFKQSKEYKFQVNRCKNILKKIYKLTHDKGGEQILRGIYD